MKRTTDSTEPELIFLMHLFVQGRWQPTRSQLIQIYSVDWTDVFDTQQHWSTEQNLLAIKVSADN